jgi:Concanavalin A-like lectin/glucanases superfamily
MSRISTARRSRIRESSDRVTLTHPLNQGRVAWWLTLPETQGGSTWYDLMGRSPAALTSMGNTSNGWRAPTRSAGKGEILLDGTAGYVAGPSPPRTYPFAIACWARLTAPITSSLDQVMICLGNKGSLEEFWISYFCGDGMGTTVYLRGIAQGGGTSAGARGLITPDLKWHRILVVWYAGATLNAYFDGVPFPLPDVTSGTVTPSGIDTLFAGALVFNGTTLYGNFGGRLDDVTVWAGNPLSVSNPAHFAAADFDQSRRGYPDALNYC